MFGVVIFVLFSVLGGAGWYLARRTYRGFSALFPKVRFWPFLVGIVTLVLLLVLGFARSFLPFPAELKHIFGIIGSYCMGIILYFLLFTLVADVIFIVPRLLKLSFTAHRFFRGFVTVGVLTLTLITCVGGFINARRIDHVSYEVELDGGCDISDMNIVMISDLHLGAVGSEERLEKIVDEINSLKPDVVCIVGDFFDTDFSAVKDPDAAVETLLKLQPTYGTYACFGNHDGGESNGQMVGFLERANICLLRESYTVIDERLVLIGRLDGSPIGDYSEGKRGKLSEFFVRNDTEMPVIVMDHNPARIDEYTTEADLILCGHTHKGQVFPGGILTDLMYTVDYGYYRKDTQSPHVIVSSGIGWWGPPMRVGTNSEIVSVRFSCGDR